jgi:uncharacterized membrane protein
MKDVAIALAFYTIAEAVWLFGMKGFYVAQFARFSVNLAVQSWLAVCMVYALLLAAAYLLLRPNPSVRMGALFGGTVYGVYNLTNKATIPGYAWGMVAVDTTWGALVFATLSYIFKRFR